MGAEAAVPNTSDRFVKPELDDYGRLVREASLEDIGRYALNGEVNRVRKEIIDRWGRYFSAKQYEMLSDNRPYRLVSASTGRDSWFREQFIAYEAEVDIETIRGAFPLYPAAYDYLVDRRYVPNTPGEYLSSSLGLPRHEAARVDVCTLSAEEESAVEPSREKLQRYALEVETLADDLSAELAVKAEDYLGYALLRNKLKLAGPLKRCLAGLGIEPLSEQAVLHYKREMILFHRAEMKRSRTWTSVSRLEWVRLKLHECSERGIEIPEFVLSRCVAIAEAMKEQTDVNFTVEKLADIDPFMLVSVLGERFYIDVWGESKFEAQL